ncbi:pyridoxal kinase [Rhodobacteraceae bacterium RKSG542]|uniref:bifunctional hydroxymethylpyrimidine kinase/phosphomethylpyrimidine kinase n=1 Tax=Pseudovibrio flavus TaxID=2529854 RepID=UPI0012BBD12E|nr:bifunctional hydroxymethylpyrimidine kinase/phosphomethylpyrimidine kinase [Pseudovibrio flavus]MTI18308.1 pyridoxal kinase [Pseudovibrio flavus]
MSLDRFAPQQPAVPQQPPEPKTILVLTAQTVCGLGGRSAVFTLERLGHSVIFLPTALLPISGGIGIGNSFEQSAKLFAALAEDMITSEKLRDVDAVLSGHIHSGEQAALVARLVSTVKRLNPEAKYLCDVSITDGEQAPARAEVISAFKEQLLPLSDYAVLNRRELAELVEAGTDTEQECTASARLLGVPSVVVTSAPALRRNSLSNLLVAFSGSSAIEHAEVPNAPKGSRGLISALFLARALTGTAQSEALKRATASTFELAARSVRMGRQELFYPANQDVLIRPMALVSERRVFEAPARA